MITKEQYMAGCEIWFSTPAGVARSSFDMPERCLWESIEKTYFRYFTSREEAELVQGLHKLNEA